jgi:hypothetical protein
MTLGGRSAISPRSAVGTLGKANTLGSDRKPMNLTRRTHTATNAATNCRPQMSLPGVHKSQAIAKASAALVAFLAGLPVLFSWHHSTLAT